MISGELLEGQVASKDGYLLLFGRSQTRSRMNIFGGLLGHGPCRNLALPVVLLREVDSSSSSSSSRGRPKGQGMDLLRRRGPWPVLVGRLIPITVVLLIRQQDFTTPRRFKG